MAIGDILTPIQQGMAIRGQVEQQERQGQIQNLLGGLSGMQPNQILQSQELAQLAAISPPLAAQYSSVAQGIDDERRKAMALDARKAKQFLKDDNIQGALGLLENRAILISEKFGGDPSHTLEMFKRIAGGDIKAAINDLSLVEQAAIDEGLIDGFKSSDFLKNKPSVQSSQILDDGTVIEVMKGGGRKVYDPSGNLVSGGEARKVVKDAKEYGIKLKKELKKLEIEAAKAKERVKGSAAREAADIDAGIEAAMTLPVLVKANKLLDIVETGKPEAAVHWFEKQFGAEGADATMLENLLGQQILKQLKPIFGAQFTAAEGQWLKDIEAGFGRSTEANRALIRQGMELVKERARIGLDAAESAGDSRAAKNINSWLEWRYKDNVFADKPTTKIGRFIVEIQK